MAASGTTTKYAIPYPLNTDPVDLSGDLFLLADKIDDEIDNIILAKSSAMITGGTHTNGISTSYNGVLKVLNLSLAQNIATTATPTFGGITINGTATATTFSGSGASLTSIPQSAVVNLVSNLSTINSNIALKADKTYVDSVTRNVQTSSYVLIASDQGKVVEMNVGSANTVQIPPDIFPLNATLDVVQIGAGQTTIQAGVGVNILSSDGKVALSKQYSAASLYQRATNVWVLMGDLS